MTASTQNSQPQTTANTAETQKAADKELNFRALEARFQRELEKERQARLEAERQTQQILLQKQHSIEEDEKDNEPYINHAKLNKTLSSFEKKVEEKIEKMAEQKAKTFVEQAKQQSWVRENPDFYETLEKHADTFAEKSPKLAESILRMPDTFERQQLVYNNIKALGIDKPQPKEPSIQEKVDANRKSPYYQPSGVANAPYAGGGDYSPIGQKNAYDQMKALQAKLRL